MTKRLLLLMISLLGVLGFSASHAATYPDKIYVTGGFNGWGTTDDAVLTATETAGQYTGTIDMGASDAVYVQFKTPEGATYGALSFGVVPTQDVAVTLVADGGGYKFAGGTYRLTIDLVGMTLLVSAPGAPEAPSYPDLLYATGGFNGWGTTDDAVLRPTETEGEYSATIDMGTDGSYVMFKTADGASYGAASFGVEPEAGVPVQLVADGGGYKFGTGAYDITISLAAMTLTATPAGGVAEPEPVPAYPAKLYVTGLFNNWGTTEDAVLLRTETEGTYEGDVTLGGADEVYFRFTDGDELTVGATEFGLAPEAGTAATLEEGIKTFKAVPGTYHMMVDLAAMTFTFTAQAVPGPQYPERIYVVGSFTGWAADESVTLQPTDVEGEYSGEVNFGAAGAYFQLKAGATADASTYGPATAGTPVAAGMSLTLVENGGGMKAEAEVLVLTVSLKDLTLTAQTPSAIVAAPAAATTIAAGRGSIAVSGGERFDVYATGGAAVARGASGEVRLPAGVYVVKAGSRVQTVLVR